MSRFVPVAVCGLLFACAGAKPVEKPVGGAIAAGEQKLDEREQRLSGISALLVVPLVNHAEAAARASAARYELVLDGQVVRKGEVSLSADIPAGGETAVEIPVDFDYARTQAELLTLAERKEPLQYALRGTIAVGGEQVEFARAAAVRPPRLPTVTLASIEALHGEDSGLTVNASVEVDNPNPFAVSVQGLHWKLALAGQPAGEDTSGRGDVLKPASHVTYEVSVTIDADEFKAKGLPTSGSIAYELQAQLEANPAQIEMRQVGQARLLAAGE